MLHAFYFNLTLLTVSVDGNRILGHGRERMSNFIRSGAHLLVKLCIVRPYGAWESHLVSNCVQIVSSSANPAAS